MLPLLQQLKKRRQTLGLKQSDMPMRLGMSRQQYQRLEARGNPRLDTLALLAKGLNSELMLIPQEKFLAVQAILNESEPSKAEQADDETALSDDPWRGLLPEDDD